jgi:molybdopterin synthase sulfur carrier subunit
MIKVLYFASLRERLGTGSEELALPAGVTDLGGLAAFLSQRGGAWKETLGSGETVMMALNQEAARASDTLKDGDEVAFFPPVTGG